MPKRRDFTAEPLTAELRLTGHAPGVSADATIEPESTRLRIAGHPPTVETYLDEVERLLRAALGRCDDWRRKHIRTALRAVKRAGPGRPAADYAAIREVATACPRKPDGSYNFKAIARKSGWARSTVRKVLGQ